MEVCRIRGEILLWVECVAVVSALDFLVELFVVFVILQEVCPVCVDGEGDFVIREPFRDLLEDVLV